MLPYKNINRIPRDSRETVRINKQLKDEALGKYIVCESRANATFSDLIEMLLQNYNNEMKVNRRYTAPTPLTQLNVTNQGG